MTNSLRSIVAAVAATGLMGVAAANAQTPSSTQKPSSTTPSREPAATRPATTTFSGDTGLWFVPTAEVLPAGRWSASGYRRGTKYVPGFTKVGDVAVTAGYGWRGRTELFGSFNVITRVDRDLRPLFINDAAVGGAVDRYPYMREGWSGNQLGDLLVGAKFNLFSQYRQQRAAVALRGAVKL